MGLHMENDYTNNLTYWVFRAEKAIKKSIKNKFVEHGYDVTLEQYIVLAQLNDHPGAIQSEVAEKTYKDKNTITRMLDLMGKNGLITRRQHDSDRRSYRIYLTEMGQQTINALIVLNKEINQELRSKLSAEKFSSMLETFEEICLQFE
jgi:DNA-binding MarR family transcriptional regulator